MLQQLTGVRKNGKKKKKKNIIVHIVPVSAVWHQW
jgi:hypothetical protein